LPLMGASKIVAQQNCGVGGGETLALVKGRVVMKFQASNWSENRLEPASLPKTGSPRGGGGAGLRSGNEFLGRTGEGS